MKKKILFIIDSLECNGAAKSAINLLNEINYSLFCVDLLILNEQDKFFYHQLPFNDINIIKTPEEIEMYYQPLKKSFFYYLKNFQFKPLYYRILKIILSKIKKFDMSKIQCNWMQMLSYFPNIESDYDVSIGYNEIYSSYFCAYNTSAKNKISWNHNDYNAMKRDVEIDKIFLKKINTVVCVSNDSLFNMKSNFECENINWKIIDNIISGKMIINFANSKEVDFDKSYINITTVARLVKQKGIDIAVEACKILLSHGYKIRWYVIGEGPEFENIKNLIQLYNIENNFILLGKKTNPYVYMKKSSIYVQPSRYEAFCITVEEAKALKLPVVYTKVDACEDRIKNNFNGLLADIDAKSIASKIEYIIDNPTEKKRYIDNLYKENSKNKIIEEFYNILF